MSGLPRASVVIPTHRRPDATVRAVRSALGQTLQPIEVIVVDDASGDGTAEAVEALADPRLRLIRLEAHQGACAARNAGILAARAPYIALLDSDDELLPESVERRVERLEAEPAAPLVYCRSFYCLAEGVRRVVPPRAPRAEDSFLEALVVEKGLATSAMLARAGALRDCLFDPALPRMQDWDVALKLARRGPVAFVQEPLAVIHAERESGRISFNFDPEAAHRLIDLHRAAFDTSPRAEAAVLHRLAMQAVRLRKGRVVERYLARAVRLDPRHRKARLILRATRAGLLPVLPFLLRLRWRWMLLRGLPGD